MNLREKLEALACEIDTAWDSDYNAHDASARIRALLAEARDDGWISVKDRLPEMAKNVLVATNRGIFMASRQHNLNGDGTINYDYLYWVAAGPYYFSIDDVTHWRPLPEPPKEEEPEPEPEVEPESDRYVTREMAIDAGDTSLEGQKL